MTLAELKSAVYQFVPELGDYLNEEALVRFFNECQRLLAVSSARLEKREVEVVDGIFTLPQGCLGLRALSWNNRNLSPWPGDTLPEVRTGEPAYYFQLGETFYLIPKNRDPGRVTVYYTPDVAEMSFDEDSPSVPGCERVLIAYAIWNACKIMGEWELAAAWERNYYDWRQDWLLLDSARNYRVAKVRNVLGFGRS